MVGGGAVVGATPAGRGGVVGGAPVGGRPVVGATPVGSTAGQPAGGTLPYILSTRPWTPCLFLWGLEPFFFLMVGIDVVV